MPEARDKNPPILVADLVHKLEQRSLPVVKEEATIEEVVAAFAESVHTRLLYVVDDEGCLSGVIPLSRIARHVLHSYLEPKFHPRHLLNMISAENARHLMQKDPVSALLDEEVETVLQRMIHSHVKEVVVVDESRRVVADLTLVDLLKYCTRSR